MLQIIPKILVLGIGCKRGTGPEAVEAAFREFCAENGICGEALAMACSIDRKADEDGILTFCKTHNIPLYTYTAEELNELEGSFSASSFVR